LTTACATFVYDLPQGLDTLVGESGYGLSEGQAQRVAVARALLQDCAVWLFDEVTSALDPSTSVELTDRLLEAGKDKVLVFVTHDLTLTERCSQVVYIGEGLVKYNEKIYIFCHGFVADPGKGRGAVG